MRNSYLRRIQVTLILIGFILTPTIVRVEEEPEWKVKVGDTMTYVNSIVFDASDDDMDGNNHTISLIQTTENGDKVNVKILSFSNYFRFISTL